MRPVERIILFLELIDGKVDNIIYAIWGFNTPPVEQLALYYTNEDKIKEFWLENPDLRFSQVLVNLGIIPNIPGSWYYLEEVELLERLGIDPTEYLLWGQNYDKDMKRLPQTIRRPICELETDHIKSIINGGWCNSPKFLDAFNAELKKRNQ